MSEAGRQGVFVLCPRAGWQPRAPRACAPPRHRYRPRTVSAARRAAPPPATRSLSAGHARGSLSPCHLASCCCSRPQHSGYGQVSPHAAGRQRRHHMTSQAVGHSHRGSANSLRPPGTPGSLTNSALWPGGWPHSSSEAHLISGWVAPDGAVASRGWIYRPVTCVVREPRRICRRVHLAPAQGSKLSHRNFSAAQHRAQHHEYAPGQRRGSCSATRTRCALGPYRKRQRFEQTSLTRSPALQHP